MLNEFHNIESNVFVQWLRERYINNFALAIFFTFTVNLFLGCILYISVPSFLFSNLGVLLGLVRAYIWGLIFAYAATYKQKMIGVLEIPYCLFFLIILLLEGEGYILGMIGGFSVYSNIFYAEWLKSRRSWLKVNLKFYKMIVLVLLISAICEVSGARIFLFIKHKDMF